tara:strand:- start:379 stop:627 length:249 start_codon:yes stop_codon:yes gene_type:complete
MYTTKDLEDNAFWKKLGPLERAMREYKSQRIPYGKRYEDLKNTPGFDRKKYLAQQLVDALNDYEVRVSAAPKGPAPKKQKRA